MWVERMRVGVDEQTAGKHFATIRTHLFDSWHLRRAKAIGLRHFRGHHQNNARNPSGTCCLSPPEYIADETVASVHSFSRSFQHKVTLPTTTYFARESLRELDCLNQWSVYNICDGLKATFNSTRLSARLLIPDNRFSWAMLRRGVDGFLHCCPWQNYSSSVGCRRLIFERSGFDVISLSCCVCSHYALNKSLG